MLSLSRTGKVQSAVDNLVLTVLSLDPKVGKGASANDLALAVSTYFGLDLDVGDVRLAIENQLHAHRLILTTTDGTPSIGLSPSSRADVATRIERSTRLEALVREHWLLQTRHEAMGVDADTLWKVLQSYLGAAFNQHGAAAVQLLDAASALPGDDNLSGALNSCIDNAGLQTVRNEVRGSIAAFFASPDANRLQYMSELLDGTFTFFALTVSEATATYLREQLPALNLFLDTNVLLGILDLQDNPLQEACSELLEEIDHEGYPFKIYYHERTLREISEILDASASRLKGRHFSSSLSRAYLQYAEGRSGGFGIEAKFHQINAQQEIDVDAFLARYNHIVDLLKFKNVLLYRQQGADLDVEAKGLAIAEFQHYLEVRARPGRPLRRYEALDHDVSVWMFLQRQRYQAASALKSGALFLSNDYSLFNFDRTYLMGSSMGKRGPTVVLPHHLLQVLRPLANSNASFDEKFIQIFAAPEFRSSQSDYGDTVTKVLSFLASFEGVPTQTAVAILNDDLLMGRLKDVETTDQQFAELIENKVIVENQTLQRSLDSTQQQLKDAAAAESARSAEALKVARQLEQEQQASAELSQQAKDTEAKQRATAEVAAAAVLSAEEAKAALVDERAKRKAAEAEAAAAKRTSRVFRTGVVVILTVALIVGLLAGPHWADWKAFEKLDNRHAIQAEGVVVIVGAAYLIAGGRRRDILYTVVFAAIIALLTLL